MIMSSLGNVQEEVAAMRACMAGAAPAECAAREWGSAQQLIKGLYALPLAAWLAAYPRSALLVLTLEELRRGRPVPHPGPRKALTFKTILL